MSLARAVCSDGLRVISSWVAPGFIQFGDDPPIAFPARGQYLDAEVQPDGDHWAVVSPGQDGVSAGYLITRRSMSVIPISTWRPLGQFPIRVNGTGFIALVGPSSRANWRLRHPNGDMEHRTTPASVGTSHSGFSSFADDGAVGWCGNGTQSPSHPDGNPTIAGRRTRFHRTSGDWTWAIDPEHGDQIIARRNSTGACYRVTTRTSQIAPSGRQQTDGSLMIALNLVDDGTDPFIHSSQFTPLASVPQPPMVPPTPPEKFPRKMFVSPYETHSARYGVTSRDLGNVCFPDKDVPAPAPYIMALDTFDVNRLPSTLYYYAHASGSGLASAKAQYVALAAKPERPIILYLDDRDWPTVLPSWIERSRTFLGLQMYPAHGESVAAFRMAMRAMCKRVKAFELPLVATPAFYDRNGTLTDAEMLAALPVVRECLEPYIFVGIMPFADMRPGGMHDHPDLYAVLASWVQAVPARPNRFDYWTPAEVSDAIAAWIQKTKYAMPVFSPWEAERLRSPEVISAIFGATT